MTQKTLFSFLALSLLVFSSLPLWASDNEDESEPGAPSRFVAAAASASVAEGKADAKKIAKEKEAVAASAEQEAAQANAIWNQIDRIVMYSALEKAPLQDGMDVAWIRARNTATQAQARATTARDAANKAKEAAREDNRKEGEQ